MEYCSNETLRQLIDSQSLLHHDNQWLLFREIVEGLAHIHAQVSKQYSDLSWNRRGEECNSSLT